MSIPPSDPSYTPSPLPTDTSQDDRLMATLSYVLGVFVSFLGPLIIWLLKKDTSKFVAFHALQALLLHAVVAAGYFISSLLIAVLIGFLTYPIFLVLGLVFSILGAIAANKGEWYDMPLIGKYARQFAGL